MTTTTNYTLPCGCVPGQHLCQEAARLWGEVNQVYEECQNAPASDYGWLRYDRALTRFWNHFYQDLTVEGN